MGSRVRCRERPSGYDGLLCQKKQRIRRAPGGIQREMTCRDFADFLDQFLERSLPLELTRQIDEHLKICADCQHYLDSYRQAGEAARAALGAADDAVAARLPHGLVKALLAARAGRQPD